MKKIIKHLSAGLMAVAFVTFQTGMTAEAGNRAPSYDFSMVLGIGEYGEQERYWYFNKNNMYLKACAKLAMQSWEDTSVNNIASYISYEETDNKLKASIIISFSNDGAEIGYNGCTSYTLNGSKVTPDYSPWDKAYISYNITNGNININDSASIISVYAHEIGHAFGLTENNGNTNSIMCQWEYGRNVLVPTSNDIYSAVCVYTK